jgi:hypothetical protein
MKKKSCHSPLQGLICRKVQPNNKLGSIRVQWRGVVSLLRLASEQDSHSFDLLRCQLFRSIRLLPDLFVRSRQKLFVSTIKLSNKSLERTDRNFLEVRSNWVAAVQLNRWAAFGFSGAE